MHYAVKGAWVRGRITSTVFSQGNQVLLDGGYCVLEVPQNVGVGGFTLHGSGVGKLVIDVVVDCTLMMFSAGVVYDFLYVVAVIVSDRCHYEVCCVVLQFEYFKVFALIGNDFS